MATLEYKGYVARIETDEDSESFHGRVLNISDVVNFKGRSMAELKREFAKSMEEYFSFCREEGDEPEQPFSGKFVLRIDPAVHRAIAQAADRDGLSINKWAQAALAKASISRRSMDRMDRSMGNFAKGHVGAPVKPVPRLDRSARKTRP
ncbi:MAG TPA: type II toxin-antitoxin system HicB family antitoxin [Gemmatimonadaceae bacterium]|nr:type II toxin-antitoxin system HicB family antitoxin [Gemmatimonadaceae bacterium]